MARDDKRLIEIIKIARKLKWVQTPSGTYGHESTMVMPAVEKCMIAMVDDNYLERMRDWFGQAESGAMVEVNGEWRPRNWKEI